jgi:hypothetical protein
VTVRETPAAVPDNPLKLLRISLRTMPVCVSTLTTPLLVLLVPSPGYGPDVSLGIRLHVSPLVVVVLPVVEVDVLLVLLAVSVVEVSSLPPPQAIKAAGTADATAPPASQRNAVRRP